MLVFQGTALYTFICFHKVSVGLDLQILKHAINIIINRVLLLGSVVYINNQIISVDGGCLFWS